VSWHSRTTTLLLPTTTWAGVGGSRWLGNPGLGGRLRGLIHHQCQLLLQNQRHSSTSSRGADRSQHSHPYLPRGSVWPVSCGEVRGGCGLPDSTDQLLLMAAPVSTPTAAAVMQPAGIPGSELCPPSGAHAMPAPPTSKQVSTSCDIASGARHHPVPRSHIGVSASAALSLIPLNLFVWFPLTAS